MSRVTPSPSVLRAANLIVLVAVVGLLAFEFGRAEADRSLIHRRETQVVAAVRHAGPAVVSVSAESRVRRGVIRRGSGSGVIIHPDGYIVTNSHVIEGGQRIRVQLWRDDVQRTARVLVDRPSQDLAVLKIENGGRALPYVSLANPSEVLLGETAIAVGNPHGLGDTITVGVVSALGRDAKLDAGVALRGLIQTDAPINTGNSGGGLLNLDGELMGIIVSILPRASGIAFAIPADQVVAVLRGIVPSMPPAHRLPPLRPSVHPLPTRPPLPSATPGLPPPTVENGPSDVPEQPAQPETSPMRPEDFGFSLHDNGAHLLVRNIVARSPASQAGLINGDVFLSIDGTPIEDLADVLLAFSRTRPGQTYHLAVRRGSGTRNLVMSAP